MPKAKYEESKEVVLSKPSPKTGINKDLIQEIHLEVVDDDHIQYLESSLKYVNQKSLPDNKQESKQFNNTQKKLTMKQIMEQERESAQDDPANLSQERFVDTFSTLQPTSPKNIKLFTPYGQDNQMVHPNLTSAKPKDLRLKQQILFSNDKQPMGYAGLIDEARQFGLTGGLKVTPEILYQQKSPAIRKGKSLFNDQGSQESIMSIYENRSSPRSKQSLYYTQ